MSVPLPIAGCVLLLAGLCAPALGTAACSAAAGNSIETAQADASAVNEESPSSQTEVELTSPRGAALPASRTVESPAPRARWHRYLPGMFK